MKKAIITISLSLIFLFTISTVFAHECKNGDKACKMELHSMIDSFGTEIKDTGQMMIDDGQLMQQKGQEYEDQELIDHGGELEQKGSGIEEGGKNMLNMMDMFGINSNTNTNNFLSGF